MKPFGMENVSRQKDDWSSQNSQQYLLWHQFVLDKTFLKVISLRSLFESRDNTSEDRACIYRFAIVMVLLTENEYVQL